jgi:hemerythrin
MSLLEWDETFSLGINEFDEHHKHLITLLNITYDCLVNKESDEKLATVLDGLLDYTGYHFAAEEHWMKEHQFEAMSKHIQEHEIFILRVMDFYRDFNCGTAHLTHDVLQFLSSWLTTHILSSDAEYGSYAKWLQTNK